MATISLIEKNEQGTKFQNDCNILKTVCIFYETCRVSVESVVMVNHMT